MRCLARLRHARVAAVAAAGVLALSIATPAAAESSGDAQRKADKILAQVQKIQHEVAAAEHAYDAALGDVASSVNAAILGGRTRDEIAALAAQQQAQVERRVRALYMTGGPMTLYAAALDGDPEAVTQRVLMVQHVVGGDRAAADATAKLTRQAAAMATAAETKAKQRIATERTVALAASRVLGLLAQEQALLDHARTRVTQLKAAEAALRAQSSAFTVITTERIATMRVLPASPAYMALYHRAALTCPGLPWSVLAAIGQVESGHGRDTSTSYAGAMGPMQFLPATFRGYAVDGDHDGVADILDPADAIFTAAHYLCANGAGTGANALYNAIFHYNHADWYVQMVLALAKQYAGA